MERFLDKFIDINEQEPDEHRLIVGYIEGSSFEDRGFTYPMKVKEMGIDRLILKKWIYQKDLKKLGKEFGIKLDEVL